MKPSSTPDVAAARNKAWSDGRKARHAGQARAANPYRGRPDGTAQAWDLGWSEVQALEDKRAARRKP